MRRSYHSGESWWRDGPALNVPVTGGRMAEVKRPPQQALPERKHGILYNLLWGWPWALVGVVLSSLLLSLLIEYIGIAFFWPEAGAAHSEAVMNTELGWLSTEFTRSLLLSEPSVTVVRWVSTAYQWAFVDSGFWTGSGSSMHQMHSDNAVTRKSTAGAAGLPATCVNTCWPRYGSALSPWYISPGAVRAVVCAGRGGGAG
jgi:hypothetical protein